MFHVKYGDHRHLYLWLTNHGIQYKLSTCSSTTHLAAKNSDFEEKLTSTSSLLHEQTLVFSKIKDVWHFFNQRIKRKNCIVIFLNNFYYLFNLHLSNYYANIHLL